MLCCLDDDCFQCCFCCSVGAVPQATPACDLIGCSAVIKLGLAFLNTLSQALVVLTVQPCWLT